MDTMDAMDAVGADVVGGTTGTADTGDMDSVRGVELLADHEPLEGHENTEIPTPRAPARVLDVERFDGYLLRLFTNSRGCRCFRYRAHRGTPGFSSKQPAASTVVPLPD